jgi:hypothetical protein
MIDMLCYGWRHHWKRWPVEEHPHQNSGVLVADRLNEGQSKSVRMKIAGFYKYLREGGGLHLRLGVQDDVSTNSRIGFYSA